MSKEKILTSADDVILSTTKDSKEKTKKNKSKSSSSDTTDSTTKKRTSTKKINSNLHIQYFGKEVSQQTILDKFNEEWLKEHKLSEIKSLDIYYKIEEDTAYCIVNGNVNLNLKII